MKPKLIMLNGPLGVGKSTLAKRYVNEHPLALNLDIDKVWASLGQWREHHQESASLSKRIALAMAGVALREGHDVIVPQILQTAELADTFRLLATQCDGEYFEILLSVSKSEAIRRYIERGKEQGYPSGFREGSIIATSGREAKLAEMYDTMATVAAERAHVLRMEPIANDIDQTYARLDALIKDYSTTT